MEYFFITQRDKLVIPPFIRKNNDSPKKEKMKNLLFKKWYRKKQAIAGEKGEKKKHNIVQQVEK